jgi:hypothetical protein
MLFVLTPVQQTRLDQLAQACGQDVTTCAGVLNDLIETPSAAKDLLDGQQAPWRCRTSG